MNRNLLLFLSLLLFSFQAVAQTGSVKGTVVDKENSEALIGANVLLEGSTIGTVTDIEGNFNLQGIQTGSQMLNVTFVGYETISVPVQIQANQTTDAGKISIGEGAFGLEEIEVIASVAIDRKTPVAVSTIKGAEIAQKIGNQEFPEILRSTPSVYVTKQGGGFGDSRINVRGFDQRNVAVMINGIPVNDMENGWVYWSNWAGLSDVTSSIQVQRGLSASKLAVSSVGGTINIITNAAEMKKGGAASVGVGNDGYQKYGLVLSTGLGENGWAFTLQGTHTRGNGYADGTQFSGWSYFASLAKQFNNRHALNFTVLGAPQWHHQREYGSFDGINIQTIEERGIKYNPQWGNYDGDEFSWRKNFYHKPKAFLNHYWTISDKTELATSAYVSLGRGGGTGDLGRINGSFRTSGKFKDAQGTVRWNDIQSWNQGGTVPDFGDNRIPWSGPGVSEVDPGFGGPFAGQNVAESGRNGFIRRSSMNEHNWFGILSNLTHEFNQNLTLVAGIDARYYKGLHYRRVEDLLGLDAYFDDDDINNSEHYVTDEGRADGNQIDYNNDGLVNWLGAFAQLEYTIGNLSIFGSGSLSNQGFKRIDYFLYEDSDPLQESDWQNFLGGTTKIGANYNINDQHNVFVNGGYFSQQPLFDNVFVNFSNEVDDEVENQNVYAIEAGYGFRSTYLSANINAYSTQWSNRQISRGVQVGGTDGTANFTDISQLHQGIEIDLRASPVERLNVSAMASFGNWRYTDNFNAAVFDNDQQLIGTGTLFMEDVKIPDAAQTTFSLNANYEFFDGFSLYSTYYYADRVFADFDISSDDSFSEPGNQAWRLPSYSLLDGGLTYNFTVSKLDLTVNLNVNNILDNDYMAESESNVLYDPAEEGDREVGKYGSVFNRVYYGFGRTWNAGLKIKF